jgi:hypothetical protein
MNMSKTARALTLSFILPFAAFAATSASAGDDQKESSALKGAAKGAVGAKVLGGSAKTGAVVGGTAGAVKKNKDDDKGANKDE